VACALFGLNIKYAIITDFIFGDIVRFWAMPENMLDTPTHHRKGLPLHCLDGNRCAPARHAVRVRFGYLLTYTCFVIFRQGTNNMYEIYTYIHIIVVPIVIVAMARTYLDNARRRAGAAKTNMLTN